jgi:F-type H+-transporting ATPase subunit a
MILTSYIDMAEHFLSTSFEDVFSPEVISSFMILILIGIFVFIVYFKAKKALKYPLKTPRGILFLATEYVRKVESLVVETMGEENRSFAGYVSFLLIYIFLCFIWGMTGFATPVTYLGVTLSLALFTLVLIHIQAIKTNHWKYFKRYLQPLPVFLPINLLTMWVPMISLGMRMFGNALADFCLMAVFYFGMQSLSSMLFGPLFSSGMVFLNATSQIAANATMGPSSIFLAWLVTPFLHACFDLFAGAIQTLVFVMLTMIYIYQEQSQAPEKAVESLQIQ